jgi:hypothetical protein
MAIKVTIIHWLLWLREHSRSATVCRHSIFCLVLYKVCSVLCGSIEWSYRKNSHWKNTQHTYTSGHYILAYKMCLLSDTKIFFYACAWWWLSKKPELVARCGQKKISSENISLKGGQFVFLFVCTAFNLIWIICCDTKYYKQYLLCKKLSEPAYKEHWNPNCNHGAEEFESSLHSRNLRKRWNWIKHFSGDYYVVTSRLCALYRLSACYGSLNLHLLCPRQ